MLRNEHGKYRGRVEGRGTKEEGGGGRSGSDAGGEEEEERRRERRKRLLMAEECHWSPPQMRSSSPLPGGY